MKAILLVEIDDDHKLKDINDLYDRMKGRWCELKTMPERYKGNLKDYEVGWNDAIEVISGEM
ncbi:MAG: hypothetical protein IKD59_05525 [Lachnospiraceae bacterium]|nr:hypothetical protein [Lachnospiraceae bacterium]